MHKTLIALAATTLLLSGCGSSSDDTPDAAAQSSSPAPSESAPPSESLTTAESASPEEDAGTTVDVEIKGGQITPNGDRVKVETGETVTLKIDSDVAGEIHVHSSPEQEITYPEGSSSHELTIEQPGIVDVEDHHADVVIVQLQVG